MALLSVAIALPLRFSLSGLARFHSALHATIGIATIAIGVATALEAVRHLIG
jgi:hypothetical protein